MLREKMKHFGMLCICFLVCFFVPMTVKAGESVTGGETYDTATEIEWDKEYTTTTADGWFKILVPENVNYIGAGHDELTSIVGYLEHSVLNDEYGYRKKGVSLGEVTEYWDGTFQPRRYFVENQEFLKGNKYVHFHVCTAKAENCSFRLIYGTHYTQQKRSIMSLNNDYVEKYYRSAENYYSSNYYFVAPSTGNYKLIVKSENGKAICRITYKDGGSVLGVYCEDNQTKEEIFSAIQGVTYYLEVYPNGGLSETSPENITFQVSNTPVSSITLNSNSLTMNKGEQFQLTTTVAPDNAVDKTVTYSTSNPQVAIVSEEGIVTAVCGGTATITVASNDGSGVQAFCQVTVIPKLVTRLDLDHDYIEADLCTCEEDGYQLRATAYPVDADNTEVTFTSSNTAIVSVDKTTGMLTLKKPGTATITCITNDGSNLTKTCKVVLKQSHLLGEKKTINKIKYKVTSDTLRGGTVAVYGVSDKNAKSYTVQNSIVIDGYSYKITAINDKAFANCKKLTDVVLGKNVKSIGKEAFSNCKKLKTLTIKSKKIKFVGKNAFKNIYSKATIKVPSSCLSKYKKLFKGKGQKSSVKIKKM